MWIQSRLFMVHIIHITHIIHIFWNEAREAHNQDYVGYKGQI